MRRTCFVGAEARFGGTVVNVANEQGRTLLEIAAVPLDSGARPILGEPSRGRLIASVNGFLEPVDFKGQLVTVVGPITGVKDGKIGMTPYKFVTMNATGYKRWHLSQQVMMPPAPMGPWAGVAVPGAPVGAWGMAGTTLAQCRCKPSLPSNACLLLNFNRAAPAALFFWRRE
jgi:outer membrane lipoprotein